MKADRSFLVRLLAAAGLLVLLLLPAAASALANQLTVQGTLLAEDGTPLSGTYELKFTLYNAGTAGKQLWTETHTDVVVTGGLFDTVLGEDPANALVLTVFVDNAQVWLGVKVEAGPGVPAGGDPELPRRSLTKVGAAFVADYALSAGNATKVGGQSTEDLTAAILAAVAAEGYVKKGTKLDQSNMPANGLNEVSNELVSNQFVDSVSSKNTPVKIPDQNPIGISDEIDFPDIGIAEDLTVSVNLTNSDMSTIQIKLFDPAGAEYLLLAKGTSAGKEYATSFPKPTKPVTGDLTWWIGKNPKGKWRLLVVDSGYLNNQTDGQINSWSVQIQTLSTKKVQLNGFVVMNKNQIKDVADPTTAQDAATKSYVDGQITNTKTYVDGQIAALEPEKFNRSGDVITDWGSKQCPAGFEKLHDGVAWSKHYGHVGNGAELLCVQSGDPGGTNTSVGHDILYTVSIDHNGGTNIPSARLVYCAKCYTPNKGPCWELVGSQTCPAGWDAAYKGWSFGQHYQHYTGPRACIDGDKFDASTNTNLDGRLYATLLWGNSGATQYPVQRALKCAMCCRK